METTIELTNVQRIYPDSYGQGSVVALDNISFAARAGETVAIVGASGAGKTTLLQIIAGLDKPTGGTVYVAGQDVSALSDSALSRFRNRTIGFVFQFFNLQSYFTAQENVALPMLLAGKRKSLAMRHSFELLDKVGLADRAKHYPAALSGGEMQRVAIARALSNGPKLLLADEPTANLDEKNATAIIGLLRDIATSRGVSIVAITHDSRLSRQFDRTLVLKKGKIQ